MKLSMYYTAGIKFWCGMEFSNYPFDKQAGNLWVTLSLQKIFKYDFLLWQTCDFTLSSNLPTQEMNVTITELIYGNDSLNCIQFTCTVERLNTMKYWYGSTDTFSSVGFKLRLERNYSKHILSYYLPSLLIVVLSWVSFVIPPAVGWLC